MKTLESVKNDVFASFADAQMSKEEMKMVKGGDEDDWYTCTHNGMKQSVKGDEASFAYCAGKVGCSCKGNAWQEWM